MFSLPFFFFLVVAIMTLGIPPLLHLLCNGGVAHVMAMCHILVGWWARFFSRRPFGFPQFSISRGDFLNTFTFFSLHFTFLLSTLRLLLWVSISLLLRYTFFLLPFFPFWEHLFPPFCLMVDYYEIRHLSPSVWFFFARLGASFGSSSNHCPWVRDFAVGGGNLYPLLCQSLDWFRIVRETLRKERMGSEIRSSDLEIGFSSSVDTTGAKKDTAAFVPALFPILYFTTTPTISCSQGGAFPERGKP